MIGNLQERSQNGFANPASTTRPVPATESHAVCVTLANRCQIATIRKKVLTDVFETFAQIEFMRNSVGFLLSSFKA